MSAKRIDSRRFPLGWWPELVVTALYMLWTTVTTWPLALRFTTSTFGYPTDNIGTIWYLWWLDYAARHGLSWRYTPMLAAPYGVDLGVFPWQIPVTYYARPLIRVLGAIGAYNTLLLVNFVFSGLGMYVLGRYLSRDRRAAFVSGLIYASSPYLVTHASYGHLSLVEMGWLPLYIWSLLRLRATSSCFRRSTAYAVVSGVLFAVLMLENYYYGYFMAVATVVFVLVALVWDLWKERRMYIGRWMRLSLVMLLVASLLILLFTLPIIQRTLKILGNPNSSAESPGYKHSFSALKHYVICWWYYILPPLQHPLLGQVSAALTGNKGWEGESILYLGWIPLLMAGGAIIASKRRTLADSPFPLVFLVALAAVALMFSASSSITIGDLKVPMPSTFLFPLLPMFRAYPRFGGIVMLAVTALAGLGIARMLSKIRTAWIKAGLVGLVCLGILIEFLPIPPTRNVDLSVPPEYSWLAEQPGEFAIAEYPLEPSAYEIRHYWYQFFQTTHQHPMVNGVTHRSMLDHLRIGLADLQNPEVPKVLSALGVKYVIIHEDSYANRKELTDQLPTSSIPGLQPVISFPQTRILEVQADEVNCVGVLYQLLGKKREGGFYPAESWPDGEMWYWMPGEANVVLFNPRSNKVQVTVNTAIVALREQRVLKIALNGRPMGQWTAGEQPVELRLPYLLLDPGINLLRLRPVGTPVRVGDVKGNDDKRQVALALQTIVVEEGSCSLEPPLTVPARCDSFGEEMELIGVEWPGSSKTVSRGKTLQLNLWWRASRDMTHDYTISLQLLGANSVLAQTDRQPLKGVYPTSQWQAGEVLVDTVELAIPEDTSLGEYPLILVVYHWPSMERLSVEGTAQNWVELSQLRVTE